MIPWGFPWHGLLISPGFQTRLRIGGAGGEDVPLTDPRFPETLSSSLDHAYSSTPNVHLLRVPGVAPLSLPAEQVAAEAALGRTWQNYTLLHTGYSFGPVMSVHGRRVGGWICIDPVGARWLVRPVGSPNPLFGDATIGQPLTARFEVLPSFGYIGQAPATPVEIETTLADIQQDGETLGGEPNVRMRPASIASHGREVLIALYPKGDSASVNDFACGWLKLELTGNGPSFGLSLSVIHSRTQAMGVKVDQPPIDLPAQTWDAVQSGSESGGVITATLIDMVPTPSVLARGNAYSRTGRILSLVYDDADQVVTMSADMAYSHDHTTDNYVLTSATGELKGTTDPGNAGANTGRIDYTMNIRVTNRVIHQISVKRDGVEVDSGILELMEVGSLNTAGALSLPYHSRLSPLGFYVTLAGTGPLVSSSWNSETTLKINGATAYSYTRNSTQLRDGSTSFAPWPWGVRANFAVDTDGPYGNVRYGLQRVNNQLVKADYTLSQSETLPNYNKTHRFIAAHATWDNPTSETDPFSLSGSYHPITHELVVGANSFLHI